MIEFIKDHPYEILIGVVVVSTSIFGIYTLGYYVGVTVTTATIKAPSDIIQDMKVIRKGTMEITNFLVKLNYIYKP